MLYSMLKTVELLMQRNCLASYYYRDGGVKVWNAVTNFVQGIVNEFYCDDEDVKNDTEVQI